MAKLTITGSSRQLAQIATQIRSRARKYGLIIEKKGFDKKTHLSGGQEKEVKTKSLLKKQPRLKSLKSKTIVKTIELDS